MEQVHIVFKSGGLLSPAQRIQGVYEDDVDAARAAAAGPLLWMASFEVIPSSSRTAAATDARPEGAATPETTSTS